MRRTLLKLLRRRRLERDLEMELALHRELSSQAGNPIPLGSAIRIKEAAADVWRFHLVEDLWRDLRHGTRALRRQPAFTGFAILALVLGIGLNVAVFTVFNAMALRPWPVRDPGRVAIAAGETFSVADARQVRDQARSFAGVTLTTRGGRAAVRGRQRLVDFVAGNYFEVLGVPMTLGRPLSAPDDRFEAPEPVVVLSHTFWKSEYGGAPDVVGRQLDVNGVPVTVVGVASREFSGGEFPRDLWLPVASRPLLFPDERDDMTAESRCCELVVRLAPGVSRSQAQAELAVIAGRLYPPERGPQPAQIRLVGTSRADSAGWPLFYPFLIAQVAVGAIFLLACANVGNLVLARTMARDRELAVRMSLGAGRARIVRQLLTEGVLFAGAATLVILLIVYGRAQLDRLRGTTVSIDPDGIAVSNVGFHVDVRVLFYAAVIALLAMLVCSLAPALQATRTGLFDAMKRQSAQATPHLPLRGVLLGVQVAISLAVLVCAALLVRGVQRASTVDVGFRSHGISAVSVLLDWKTFNARGTGDAVSRLRDELAPVGPVGVTARAPLSLRQDTTAVVPDADGRLQERVSVAQETVDAGYFDILDIPILAGRNFVPRDRDRDVVVVNESMARRYWPAGNPVGQIIRLPVRQSGEPRFEATPTGFRPVSPGERAHEIIGIVRDAYLAGPTAVAPTIFRVHTEADQGFVLLVPERAAAVAGAAVSRLDSHASVSVTRLGVRLDAELASARMLAGLASGLGLVALLLAATGVYGVIAYAVEGRRREIGIRMALGASARTVVTVVIGRNAGAVGFGLAIGLVLAIFASKILESQLYGVSRLDPVAYAGVLLLLVASALAASALPARRAIRIDPVKVLHAD